MIIPEFWAESRRTGRRGKRRATVRRFGFSDESLVAAQRHADERAAEALEQILAGADLPRRELRRAYGGDDGLPIREEIVARHGEVVITRNSYGARCLNVSDVLFVDVDLDDAPSMRAFVVFGFALAALAVALGISRGSWWIGCVGVSAALALSPVILDELFRLGARVRGGAEAIALGRIRDFAAAHPSWRLRVYRTPAGFRVLVLHRTFDARDDAVTECFDALGADPAYVRMCRAQRCFRARISPKPWRVGEVNLSKVTRAVWPVTDEVAARRRQWIERYEGVARDYAACVFVEEHGSGRVDPHAESVRRIHDDACHAATRLPLA